MSNTIKTANNKLSNNKIIVIYHFTSWFIETQLDNIEIGIIIVVSKTKYIDKPSNPR